MQPLKEKIEKLHKHKKEHLVGLAILLVCIILILLSFFPDFSPIFHRNTVSIFNSIQNNLHNTTPVSYLQKKPIQNDTIILDKPIQSTGCGVPLSLKIGTSTYIEIKSANTKRRFIVYLPNGYKNTTEHSLILAFHGYASNPFALEKFTHFNSVANSGNIIMVYPEGTTSLAGLRGWNTGIHPTINANDILFVSNMLNALQSNLCINSRQIYAAGFSNGGSLVAKLACNLSNRIAAYASVSGAYVTAFKTCDALRPLPIIEFHGTKDTRVPYLGLAAKKEFAALTWVSRWGKRDRCNPQPIITNETDRITKYMWTDCNDNASVIHYKIKGEGHSWPHRLFAERVNNHVKRVNAAAIIWNFFIKHPLPKNAVQSPETSSA